MQFSPLLHKLITDVTYSPQCRKNRGIQIFLPYTSDGVLDDDVKFSNTGSAAINSGIKFADALGEGIGTSNALDDAEQIG